MKRSSHSGSTTTEYGIILAVVVGLGIYGLKLLGPAISGNLNMGAQSQGTMSILSPVGGSSGGGSNGGFGNGAQPGGPTGGPTSGSASSHGNLDTTDDSSATVQTVGSNGAYDTVYSSSNELMQFAEKYKEEDPEVYQMIVNLGIQGQGLADQMMEIINAAEAGRDDTIQDAHGQQRGQGYDTNASMYRSNWDEYVSTSEDFQRMTPADQDTVRQLVEETFLAVGQFDAARPALFQTNNGSKAETATSGVDDSNVAVEDCGHGGCD